VVAGRRSFSECRLAGLKLQWPNSALDVEWRITLRSNPPCAPPDPAASAATTPSMRGFLNPIAIHAVSSFSMNFAECAG
jgi:hypothetical protein